MITRIESNKDLAKLKAGQDQIVSIVITDKFGETPQIKRVSRKEYRALRDKEAMGQIYQISMVNAAY